jgi:hypothetical protein
LAHKSKYLFVATLKHKNQWTSQPNKAHPSIPTRINVYTELNFHAIQSYQRQRNAQSISPESVSADHYSSWTPAQTDHVETEKHSLYLLNSASLLPQDGK